MLVEGGKPRDRLDDIGGFVHDDNGRRAETGLHGLQAIEIHQHVVADRFRQERHGRAAGNDGKEIVPAAAHTACMFFKEFLEGDTHFLFDIAGPVHMAGNAEELGAGVVGTAEAGEPGRAAAQDRRGDRYRFDVVDGRRRAIKTDIRRERWLQTRHPLLAFKAFEKCRFLAADISPGAMMDINVEAPARARRIRPEEACVIGFVDGGLKPLALANEFTAHIDVANMRAHREGGDEAALDQLVRIVAHDVAILAGAGFGFVRVDHQVMGTAIRLLRHEGPFEAGREAGAATAAQTRLFHFVENPVTPPGDDVGRAIPIATAPRRLQAPVMEPVEIGKNTILVFKHQLSPPVCAVSEDVRLVSPPAGSDE